MNCHKIIIVFGLYIRVFRYRRRKFRTIIEKPIIDKLLIFMPFMTKSSEKEITKSKSKDRKVQKITTKKLGKTSFLCLFGKINQIMV